jgi:hypothetical protein
MYDFARTHTHTHTQITYTTHIISHYNLVAFGFPVRIIAQKKITQQEHILSKRTISIN